MSFLAAVRSSPADDLPRLVFADWLDENGQPERAAWLRHEVYAGSTAVQWFPVGGGVEYLLTAGVFGATEPITIRLAEGMQGVEFGASRGAVSHARGPITRLLEVLPTAALTHPIQRAEAMDYPVYRATFRGPDGRFERWVFDVTDNRHRGMPRKIRDAMDADYATRDEANTALSDAILADVTTPTSAVLDPSR